MHRVDTPGSVNGMFSDGNPAAGQQATQLLAAWFNDLQENLAYVIESNGIDLVKGDATQLAAAMVALVAGAVGDGSCAVPTARTLTGAGLVQAIGDLSANRTITVPKASSAEVAAGTDDTKAITPLALAGGAGSKLLAGIGFVHRIDGTIGMWGTFSVLANSSVTITLPDTFPTMCTDADAHGGRQDYSAEDNDPFVSGKSTTSITIFNPSNASVTGTWRAEGF